MRGRRVPWAGALGIAAACLGCGDEPAQTPSDADSGVVESSTGGMSAEIETESAASLDSTGQGSGGDTTDSSSGADETSTGEPPGCTLPAGVNAMLDAGGVLRPLVPVTAGGATAVAYERDGEWLHALDPLGETRWSAQVGAGALSGGFDFDADGWPDLVVAHHEEGPVPCGMQTVGSSWLTLWHGVDGQLAGQTPAEDDICWTFGAVTYPTIQWTAGTVLFGPDTSTLLTSPTYASTSSLLSWSGSGFSSTSLYYPSTASYDATYSADLPNAWGTGTSYLANSHIANGLMMDVAGESRAVLFTSGRVVQYAEAPLDATQLRADRPYLTGGRTDIAGRNYGLVTRDPSVPSRVALLSGTTAYSLHADMVAGAMTFDPWGQIERHVSLFDPASNTVLDRFYSYAHDAGDGHQYEGRVAYPDSPWVRVGPGQPSRLAYSVYEAGHWVLHVSEPGSLGDALALQGSVLWDIRDLDGDGIDEWIVSPSELPGDPDVPGYYFARWQTELWHWDEGSTSLVPVGMYEDGIPALTGAIGRAMARSSMGALYPVPVVANEGCEARLVLRTPEGAVVMVGLP